MKSSHVNSNGYRKLRWPGHPLADSNGEVYEHRVVAMEGLGRPLGPGEVVHHKNGDKLDNRPENLEVCPSNADHLRLHRNAADEDIAAMVLSGASYKEIKAALGAHEHQIRRVRHGLGVKGGQGYTASDRKALVAGETRVCRRDHPQTEENVYRNPRTGWASCRICARERPRGNTEPIGKAA